MLLPKKNIALIRIVLAVLVLGASSGFTAVLTRCQMEAASCCSMDQGDDMCDQPATLPAGHAIQADLTCQTTTVVGGLAINQALAQKENKQEPLKTLTAVVISPGFHCTLQPLNSSYTIFAGPPHPPPSVEKYVLFGSFLI